MSKEFEEKALKEEELDKISGGYMFGPPSHVNLTPHAPASNPGAIGFGPPPRGPGKPEPC